MKQFQLKIVTPDGLCYEGPAEEIVVRTTTGDMGIMAGHINCIAPLGMGRATMLLEGKRRYGACVGGMVTVVDGLVTVVATTFEWAEDIDIARAKAAENRAREQLGAKDSTDVQLQLAQARLKRALIRQSVASQK